MNLTGYIGILYCIGIMLTNLPGGSTLQLDAGRRLLSRCALPLDIRLMSGATKTENAVANELQCIVLASPYINELLCGHPRNRQPI